MPVEGSFLPIALQLDLLIRGFALSGGLVFLCLWCWRPSTIDRAQLSQLLPALSIFACFALYLILSSPSLGPALMPHKPEPIFITMTVPLIIWGLALVIFDDSRTLGWLPVAAIFMLIALHVGPLFSHPLAMLPRALIRIVVSGVICTLLIYQTINGYASDLVEQRRRLRPWLICIALIMMVIIIASEFLSQRDQMPLAMITIQALCLAGITFAAPLLWLYLNTPNKGTEAQQSEAMAPNEADQVDPLILQKIETAMENQIWRTEGLTIGDLANDIQTPEYLVRKTINQGLGHKNFPQFLNAQRVQAAIDHLSDPQNSHTPITSLAFDLGFGSLGSFTRAFKEATGQNPSAFRKSRLAPKL